MLLILLFLINVSGKFMFNHIIKTNYTSIDNVYSIMRSKQYFDLYLKEVKANNINFIPIIKDKTSDTQTVSYICKPVIGSIMISLPNLLITQTWNYNNNNTFVGNIDTYYINFDLTIEIKKNDKVYLDIMGCINRKIYIIPNIAIKYALYDYDNIFQKIIKQINTCNL
jgi:hypothetical protein